MSRSLCTLVLLLFLQGSASICIDTPPIAQPRDASTTCGDGVLQPSEVCDDGNRLNGDGCNAWCNAFDRYTTACTLSGSSDMCPNGHPVLGPAASAVFCSLTAIAAATRSAGDSLFLADGGVLMEYPLMNSANTITAFAATSTTNSQYSLFCGIVPMSDPDTTVFAYECASQSIIRFASPGQNVGVSTVAALSAFLQPVTKGGAQLPRPYYDASTNQLIVVGAPLHSSDGVAGLYSIQLSASMQQPSLIALIPSVFDVPNNLLINGLPVFSYDASGMLPFQVVKQQCTPDVGGMCYVVYMSRGDLHQVQAYVPVTGVASSTNIKYRVSTDAMLNAMGTPLVKIGIDGQTTHTLVGGCLSTKPPAASTITLADTCSLVASNGWHCATPLKNAFTTDVLNSPFLMPAGFSSSLTHDQLSRVFGNTNMASSNVTGFSGATLYQQLLKNAYAGTLPLDMAQVSSTGDIMYITPTALHMLSSKGIVLQDYQNYPYCLAHNAILCPTGQFGSVGGVCQPCPAMPSQYPTVAEQIQCVLQPPSSGQRRLLSNSESPPAVTFTMRTGYGVLKEEIDLVICRYMTLRGYECDITPSQISALMPANIHADLIQAGNLTQTSSSMYDSLQRSAAQSGILSMSSDTSEFSMSWVVQSTALLDCSSVSRSGPIAVDLNANPIQSSNLKLLGITADAFVQKVRLCDFLVSRGTRKYVQCAIQSLRGIPVNITAMESSRRRLLGLPAVERSTSVRITEQNPSTYISSTSVNFNRQTANGSNSTTITTSNSDSGGASSAAIIGIGVGVGVVVLVLIIVFSVMNRSPAPVPPYAPLKQS